MSPADSTRSKSVHDLKPKRTMKLRSATIARYVARIMRALPIQIFGCETQLIWLLSETSRDAKSAMFAHCLRSLARARLTDDEHAQLLLEAVELSVIYPEQRAALAPTHEGLSAYVITTATSPSLVMRACRGFVSLNSTDLLSFPAPVDEIAKRSRVHSRKKFEVDNVVAYAVRRIVTMALSASLSPSKLAFWSVAEREAALTALWLAYSRTSSGTTGTSLSQFELIQDFVHCGKPLWRKLVATATQTEEFMLLKDRWSDLQVDRMTISLQNQDKWDWESDDKATDVQFPTLVDRRSLVICPSAIVPATDKYDREEVERHKILETPLLLVGPPSPTNLRLFWELLQGEFPWATAVLDVIFTDLIGHANLGAPYLKVPATLLVGEPGSGKSRLVRRLAEVLALPRLDISLGGMTDTKVLAGTSRGWASGRPSGMATLLAKHKTASALVMLDELDKASGHSSVGDAGLSGYLLGLLEPETARRHYDTFLKTECDFSAISWLCTANSLYPLSRPMVSRLRVLHMRQPAPEHFDVIAESVMSDLASRYAVPREVLPSLKNLQIDLSRLGSARAVRTAVEAVVGRWSSEIVRH